jgi:hypothetical protein
MDREAVSARLREHHSILEKLGVKSLASFGSLARGEVGPESDVDLLVEFAQPVGLFEFIRLKQALEQMLEQEVDLVTPDALRESMRAEILEEAVDVTP